MPKTNIYGERNLRAVTISLGAGNAAYVFKINVDASEVTELGQVDASTLVAGGPGLPVIVGLGKRARPKAARLKKKKEGITSLCSTGSIASALATKKWQIAKRAISQGRVAQKSTAFGTAVPGGALAIGSVLVAVQTAGLNWAWRMPAQQFNKIGSDEATALGITIPNTDAEFRRLLIQADLPRPGRAFRQINTTAATLKVETFIADGATLPEAWTSSGSARKFGD
ncbi:MAG: hypothetical protein JGK17_31115 [Microcoleus sp. PH2017_10_PVI_O_A]|uniref:hypothetical protein n=1 Tax=unclassified Microcoleus TaxID=2642155 RepID=UPI001D597E92|nr:MULTISPECIES: hypothetical protein [unclassified Microcoleus]MCC3409911.1 hypothetical protein [Microcoleus sp. PH2017_10_PVI_O_A]MCC3464157.1 hypothetical protein [Microcoleus sp. PH2017_11_PCY_U_A]MCC3482500.1 hypothetical protein [Microcoleus sp. PH2017_12_PCY_D_A]MCC3532299.1 hypothetical protein [Microcoleus sp. PH2017_21_RUC_O_A]MCC3544596.1 hypothetical protein [Microcoleus sp. PH2017_22_RUC_O_B]